MKSDIDVLLVEDDHAFAAALLRSLREKELTTDSATDVEEARRLLARHAYSVVILDLVLGASTGLEVVEFIRTLDNRPGAVIVITGAAPTALLELDRTIVSTVFFKPLDFAHLAAFVHLTALRIRHA